jgi:hypothetical protein
VVSRTPRPGAAVGAGASRSGAAPGIPLGAAVAPAAGADWANRGRWGAPRTPHRGAVAAGLHEAASGCGVASARAPRIAVEARVDSGVGDWDGVSLDSCGGAGSGSASDAGDGTPAAAARRWRSDPADADSDRASAVTTMMDRPRGDEGPVAHAPRAPEDLWQERDAMLAKIARLASALAVILEAPTSPWSSCVRCEEAARVAREALR